MNLYKNRKYKRPYFHNLDFIFDNPKRRKNQLLFKTLKKKKIFPS